MSGNFLIKDYKSLYDYYDYKSLPIVIRIVYIFSNKKHSSDCGKTNVRDDIAIKRQFNCAIQSIISDGNTCNPVSHFMASE